MGIDHSAEIDAAPEELWALLERPGAIHRLIPPWQPMTVVQEAANLRDGTAKLRVAGAPWTSQHQQDGYVDGQQFVDELTSFPLRLVNPWRHEHRVQAAAGGRSVMSDRVITPAPAALLRATFEYRHRQLAGDLAAHAAYASRPLTVAVTGGSGLIGSQLTALLTTGGHRVIRLVRHPASGADERQWDTDNPAEKLLDGVDAVVHLAGEGIAGRFTEAHKKAVRDSRIGPTRRFAELAAAAGVGTFVSASAIGIYGADRGDEPLDETAIAGDDFLANLVVDWEADSATVAAADSNLRAVQVRTGIVVTPRGGFLSHLRPLFALGVGGRLGSGEQWLSWIGIDDLLDIYLRVLTDASLSGPVNAVAPNPVRNKEFTTVFGHVLHRPTIVPVPSFGPKLLLGTEGAAEVAEASQRVTPAVLERAGHRFRNPDLESALRHVMGKG
ncbi:MAG: TIGR01777 family oxidoreductase [Nakamurella sp.]